MGRQRLVPLIARVLLSLLFLESGIGKLGDWSGTAAQIASVGLPMPQLLAAGAILVEVGGAALLILGFATRIAAGALIAFALSATVLFHNFWTFQGEEQAQQLTQFLKNLGIVGGLSMIAAFGPGHFSVDDWLSRRDHQRN